MTHGKRNRPFWMLLLFAAGSILIGARSFEPTTLRLQENVTITPPTMDPIAPCSSMTACDKARQMILDRNFTEWTGLPIDCEWTSLTGPLPTDWSIVPGRPLLTQYERHSSIQLKLPGYYQPYFTYVKGELVLFDAMPQRTAEADAAFVASLGTPDQCLQWQEGIDEMPATECIFAARGMTVFLNEERNRVVHIALYPPCDPTHYVQFLRPNLGFILSPSSSHR